MENMYLKQLATRISDIGELVKLSEDEVQKELGTDLLRSVGHKWMGEPLMEDEALRLFRLASTRMTMIKDSFMYGERLLVHHDLSHEQCVQHLTDATFLSADEVVDVIKRTIGGRFDRRSTDVMPKADRCLLANAFNRDILEREAKLLAAFGISRLRESELKSEIKRRVPDGIRQR